MKKWWLITFVAVLLIGGILAYQSTELDKEGDVKTPIVEHITNYLTGKEPEEEQKIEEEEEVIVDKGTEIDLSENTLVDTEWISFVVPKKITTPGFELEARVLAELTTLEMIWKHPSTQQEDQHTLQKFSEGESEASYRAHVGFRNFLPGVNKYEIIGRRFRSDVELPEEEYRKKFEVVFDLQNLPEVSPQHIIIDDFPEDSGFERIVMNGKLTVEAAKVQVYSFHPKTGKSTFAVLNKFDPEEKSFTYNMQESFDNLYTGINEYFIEALDEDAQVITRKKVEFSSSRLTLDEEIKEFVGEFQKYPGGWYVSKKLPWFSLRKVYENLDLQTFEDSLMMPRPSLLYTAEASLETPLCEYLGSLDYEFEGYSYEGYSYETCQTYRHGVMVYDRFVSVLLRDPFLKIKKTRYKEKTSKLSSAFVMIETGGMTSDNLSLDEALEAAVERETLTDKKENFYIFQMQITEDVPKGEEKLIGGIAKKMTEERKENIEKMMGYLKTHRGDQLFGEFLKEFEEEDE